MQRGVQECVVAVGGDLTRATRAPLLPEQSAPTLPPRDARTPLVSVFCAIYLAKITSLRCFSIRAGGSHCPQLCPLFP